MAFEVPLFDVSFQANADLSSLQYYIVKMGSTAMQIGTCSATTDTPIGILQNKPGSLGAASVRVLGISKCIADGTTTPGSMVVTSADAQGAMQGVGSTLTYTLGVALDNVTNAGEIFSVLLTHAGRGA